MRLNLLEVFQIDLCNCGFMFLLSHILTKERSGKGLEVFREEQKSADVDFLFLFSSLYCIGKSKEAAIHSHRTDLQEQKTLILAYWGFRKMSLHESVALVDVTDGGQASSSDHLKVVHIFLREVILFFCVRLLHFFEDLVDLSQAVLELALLKCLKRVRIFLVHNNNRG